MRRSAAPALALILLLFALAVSAQPVAADPTVTDPAMQDTVSVSEIRDLSASVTSAALAAAADAGAAAAVFHGGTLKMVRVWRGPNLVQAAPLRYAFPMVWAALDASAAGSLRGRAVGDALAVGQVVMGRTTADLRGAQAGDVVDVYGWDAKLARLTIGLVAEDALMGGAELLFSTALAAPLKLVRASRVVVWGFERDALQAALTARGLDRPDVRIRHSWDAPDPDSQISTARTKALLGEFAYRTYGGRVLLQPAWVNRSLPRGREVLNADIPIRARCHVAVRESVKGALAELAATGLASAVDVYDTNRWGGCFNARFTRSLGRDIGGQLSRHTWAMAIDLNVRANSQGDEPQMDCGIVRIFRKWGFAWGGNFVSPDGMHFEYVGERRDLLQFPSTRCPNLPDPGTAPAPAG